MLPFSFLQGLSIVMSLLYSCYFSILTNFKAVVE